MNTKNEIIQKRIYSTPQIERIQLDNEISLVLQSESISPPFGPGGFGQNLQAPEHFNNDPFKNYTA